MDERAKIPVSLPCDKPTVSYWQDPPDPIADHRTTPDLPPTADTVIIGSGITGTAVAWNLLQSRNPGTIVMLEARQACSGATGRNGGHTKAASYRTYAAHRAAHGARVAAQVAALELRGILALHDFADAHAIPCDHLRPDFGPGGPGEKEGGRGGGGTASTTASTSTSTIDVIYDPAEWAAAVSGVAAIQRDFPAGAPEATYTLYSREEVLERFRVHDVVVGSGGSGSEEQAEEKVQGGVGYPAGSLSAYRFAIGVLRLCLERGLNLQTGTPVLELAKVEAASPPPSPSSTSSSTSSPPRRVWEVRTARGVIKAPRVVLATNGYTAAIWKPFQGVVVPLRGQVTAQRPGRSMPRGGCLETTYSFVYRGGYEYMVSRPDGARFAGDVVIGGGLARAEREGLSEFGTADDGALNEGISSYLREAAARYFGPDWGDDHPDGRVRNEWTGIMGFSPDGFPFVGEVPGESGLWTSCSFQGHGMVLCWMCARALVDMMEGRDDEQLRDWFPDVFRITRERLALKFQGRLDSIPHVGDD
ncbi:FAD dependent oxidoreductase [Thermothelomyces heterothallicus CBS 202.75]|uniref:FAD dependent oxidoreductase n=1 Tax=Thermothelomyces heterothallicus CBS 202.75 TaxID=1149848 RepID=UPI0037431791